MTAEQLLSECEAVGLRFVRRGDRLAVDAEPGAMTPAVKAWLRDEKETILRAVDSAQTRPPRQPARAGRTTTAGTQERRKMTNCERCDTTAGVDARVYLAGQALPAITRHWTPSEVVSDYYEKTPAAADACVKIADAILERLAAE